MKPNFTSTLIVGLIGLTLGGSATFHHFRKAQLKAAKSDKAAIHSKAAISKIKNGSLSLNLRSETPTSSESPNPILEKLTVELNSETKKIADVSDVTTEAAKQDLVASIKELTSSLNDPPAPSEDLIAQKDDAIENHPTVTNYNRKISDITANLRSFGITGNNRQERETQSSNLKTIRKNLEEIKKTDPATIAREILKAED